MLFRGYRAGDLEAMYALDVACFEPHFRFSRQSMRRFAEAAKARVVLAEHAGVLAGFCLLHVERAGRERVGYVVTLDVAPGQRRKGLATELMLRAEMQAAVAGCAAMVLHVHSANVTAVGFYERSGYAFAGTDTGFYGVDAGGASVDAFVYRKTLARS